MKAAVMNMLFSCAVHLHLFSFNMSGRLFKSEKAGTQVMASLQMSQNQMEVNTHIDWLVPTEFSRRQLRATSKAIHNGARILCDHLVSQLE